MKDERANIAPDVQRFQRRYGPWAVVTGASSGIGAEFAHQLAALGINVVLVARRRQRLDELALALSLKHGVQTRVVEADVSDTQSMVHIEEVTRALDVGLLVNNAGFATTGPFLEQEVSSQLKLLDTDCRAPLQLSYHFGRRLVARGRGGIINVASASSFLPIPHWASYAAAKCFLLHFSEALWFELRPRGVDVLALCPGLTRTEFADVSGSGQHGGMDPQPVVKQALRCLGHQPVLVPGWGNRLATWLPRLLSRRIVTLLGARVMRASRVA